MTTLTDPDQVEEHVARGGVVAAVHEPGLRHLLVAGLQEGEEACEGRLETVTDLGAKPRETMAWSHPSPQFLSQIGKGADKKRGKLKKHSILATSILVFLAQW